MYIQKIPFTRNNISGYASVRSAGQKSEQHTSKTEKQMEVLRPQLFLRRCRGMTQNNGWKQKLLLVLVTRLVHEFLCFIHPSCPQPGTLVLSLATWNIIPSKMDTSNQGDSQIQARSPEESPRGYKPI